MIRRSSLAAFILLLSACSSEAQNQEGTASSPWSQAPANASSQEIGTAPAEEGENEEATAAHPAADPPRAQVKYGSCANMFPGGLPPAIVNPEYASAIKPTYDELCYRSFALGHSGLTRTAIWSAEVLDPQRMNLAAKIKRDSTFEEDDRLQEDRRSKLEDYRRSGYDRGHLAPSADMPSRESQQESFRLSNIVPQNGRMNGGVWRDLEMNVREEARKRRVYVVTGPIFENSNKALRKRVLVPTSMYKAMFSVEKGAVVFVVTNDNRAKTTTLSIDQFTTIYGIDPFPALKGLVRQHNIALGPIPESAIKSAEDGSGGEASSDASSACRQFKTPSGTWMKEDFYKLTYGNQEPAGIRPCPNQ